MTFKRELGGSRLQLYVFASLLILFLLGMLLPPCTGGPSARAVREGQRQVVRERVEALGGWEVLRRDCLELVKAAPPHKIWAPHEVGGLSNSAAAVAHLQPRVVRVESAPGEPRGVSLFLFGGKSTGGRVTPHYSLWVVCDEATTNYVPKPELGTAHKVANSVFEIY